MKELIKKGEVLLKKKTILIVIILLFLGVSLYFNFSQTREVNEIDEKNKRLEKEYQSLVKEKEIKKANKKQENKNIKGQNLEENSFEEDTKWLTEEIYTNMDRKSLYDNISVSLTDKLEKDLFGEEPIKDKKTKREPSISKNIDGFQFYGKYIDEKTYETVSTFDLEIEAPEVTEKHFVVVRAKIKKEKGKWHFSEFDEIASRNQ